MGIKEEVEVKLKGEVRLLIDVLDVLEEYFKAEGISSSRSGEEGKAHLTLKHGGLDD